MTRLPVRVLALVLLIAPPAYGETASPKAAPASTTLLTLAECYKLAKQQSERIAMHQELIAEAEGRFTQAMSGILPRLSLNSSDRWQDGTGSSPFTRKHVPERKMTVSQPLFSGFREFAAMAGVKAEKRQRELEKTRAEHLLAVDVSDAFYLVLQYRKDLEALEAIHAALDERRQELHTREQLGRSRPSEVVSTEAQRLRVEAEIQQFQREAIVVRQLLEFLIGRPIEAPLEDPETMPHVQDSLETLLAKMMDRPDVRAAEEAVTVAERQIGIEKADYWPDVDVEGNYFFERGGVAQEIDWDAELTVKVPIFEGGQVAGAVSEAKSKARQARLQLAQIKRQAILDIKDRYAEHQAGLAQTQTLGKAVDAADESYRFQLEDYRRNLVSHLDVLEALQNLQDIRRSYIQAHYEALRTHWRLRTATGETP